MSIEQILEQVISRELLAISKKSRRIMILAPVVSDRKGEYTQLFTDLLKKGFSKARVDGEIRDLSDDFLLIKTNKHTIEVVVDRLVLDKDSSKDQSQLSRLHQSLEAAAKLGEGLVIVAEVLDASLEFPANPKKMEDHLYSERFACPVDNIALADIEPRPPAVYLPLPAAGRRSRPGDQQVVRRADRHPVRACARPAWMDL